MEKSPKLHVTILPGLVAIEIVVVEICFNLSHNLTWPHA